jgi:hypothetical protein
MTTLNILTTKIEFDEKRPTKRQKDKCTNPKKSGNKARKPPTKICSGGKTKPIRQRCTL